MTARVVRAVAKKGEQILIVRPEKENIKRLGRDSLKVLSGFREPLKNPS